MRCLAWVGRTGPTGGFDDEVYYLPMLRDYSLQPTEVPVHTPAFLSDARRNALKADIKRLLEERDAVLVAHYYVDGDIQTSPTRRVAAWPTRWRWRASAAIIQPAR